MNARINVLMPMHHLHVPVLYTDVSLRDPEDEVLEFVSEGHSLLLGQHLNVLLYYQYWYYYEHYDYDYH